MVPSPNGCAGPGIQHPTPHLALASSLNGLDSFTVPPASKTTVIHPALDSRATPPAFESSVALPAPDPNPAPLASEYNDISPAASNFDAVPPAPDSNVASQVLGFNAVINHSDSTATVIDSNSGAEISSTALAPGQELDKEVLHRDDLEVERVLVEVPEEQVEVQDRQAEAKKVEQDDEEGRPDDEGNGNGVQDASFDAARELLVDSYSASYLMDASEEPSERANCYYDRFPVDWFDDSAVPHEDSYLVSQSPMKSFIKQLYKHFTTATIPNGMHEVIIAAVLCCSRPRSWVCPTLCYDCSYADCSCRLQPKSGDRLLHASQRICVCGSPGIARHCSST